MAEMFVVLFVAIHKVPTLKKSKSFWFWVSFVCTFGKKITSLKEQVMLLGRLPLPPPFIHIWTLSMDLNLKIQINIEQWPMTGLETLKKTLNLNLKMSTIRFVLRYIKYKERVKSGIWHSKVHPWLHRQADHQMHRQMHFFLHILNAISCVS